MKAVVLILAAVLAGCASTEPAPPPVPIVTITPPVYCQIYSKITWSRDDTFATVSGIQRENAKFDRICGSMSKKVASR